MKLIQQTPAKTLHPAYRVSNVERSRLERFKTELTRLLEHLSHSATESEEHLKNIVSDFLKGAFYRDEHFVNTKDRQDLVIHNGRTAKDSVGVIIETKKPGNKAEMLSPDKPNTKALHELLRYYLNERSRADNKEIRHLVVTDIHHWYLFDAADFERHIYANNKLLKQYADWSEGRLGAGNTDWFYKEIAAPFFENELPELRCCAFDLRDYAEAATNADPGDDDSLLDLYKILSPEHLLKKPFANDSNTLNKQFYDELLYILGLEEVKEGGKKIIDRAGKRRHDGSLLENTLSELEVSGVWRDVPNPEQFGDTPEQQRFSIALELCITWLNRILFLKLLEGQLLRWSRDLGMGRLLNPEKVKDFDEINELFFHVLAAPENERRESVAKKFGEVPYLNSSLFEQTELERRTLRISALKDRLDIPLAPNTVLRDGAGKRREGRMNTLHYLFAFLDAYDFSSDAKARIQADNRDVINASVLGLIFEKINGYRDGSFFTPGFITMYMCRETLRRAVLQKFNERYGWDCQNIETDLHNELMRQRTPLAVANELVNSLRICDPAVGSGHFLVSALNELIAVKSDLGILCDRNGKLLPLRAVVGNDELILTDPDTDAPFEYKPGVAASQRIQETLFHEKQTLIENCLFGVDINPKSVMICRLRLWIELLKHAYFKPHPGPPPKGGNRITLLAGEGRGGVDSQQTLETLPNIDINIKTGNSLVSRFALDEDLKDVFAKGKIKANDYRLAVAAYKNATDKTAKAALLEQIGRVKSAIYDSFYFNNPLNKKLKKLLGDRFLLENKAAVGDLFEKLKSEDISGGLDKLNREIIAVEAQIEELKQGKTYRNSFEWRFEFPEVLDDEGGYVGFDVVIGNPPYIRVQDIDYKTVDYFKTNYSSFYQKSDVYLLFIERALTILKPFQSLCFINPTLFMNSAYGRGLRGLLLDYNVYEITDFGDTKIFEEAITYTGIFKVSKSNPSIVRYRKISGLNQIEQELYRKQFYELPQNLLTRDTWTLDSNATIELISKIKKHSKLSEFAIINSGCFTGFDEAFFISDEEILNYNLETEIIKPIVMGKEPKKYFLNYPYRKSIYPYEEKNGNTEIIEEETFKKKYPNSYAYISRFRGNLLNRKDSRVSFMESGRAWYSYTRKGLISIFISKKIIVGYIVSDNSYCFDDYGFMFSVGRAFAIISKENYLSNYLLLGILNSSVSKFLMRSLCPIKQGGFYKISSEYLSDFPIPNTVDDITKKLIISLVTRILSAKQTDPQADTSALEAEVDRLVYGLYGLTEEEIAIVEGR